MYYSVLMQVTIEQLESVQNAISSFWVVLGVVVGVVVIGITAAVFLLSNISKSGVNKGVQKALEQYDKQSQLETKISQLSHELEANKKSFSIENAELHRIINHEKNALYQGIRDVEVTIELHHAELVSVLSTMNQTTWYDLQFFDYSNPEYDYHKSGQYSKSGNTVMLDIAFKVPLKDMVTRIGVLPEGYNPADMIERTAFSMETIAETGKILITSQGIILGENLKEDVIYTLKTFFPVKKHDIQETF